jgi:hypothetical protein
VRFAVPKAMIIKIMVSWNVILCNIVDTFTGLHGIASQKTAVRFHKLLNYLLVEEVSWF